MPAKRGTTPKKVNPAKKHKTQKGKACRKEARNPER
jgi:hypothetical protein